MKKMKSMITEDFCNVMSYLTVALGVVLVALVIMNYPKITSFLDRTIFNQVKETSSALVTNNTEWKNLDESERVLKAIEMGGCTEYLNKREIKLYNEVVRFMNSVQGKTDYEIALAAHDWVIDNITYDDDAAKKDNELSYVSDSASAYGGLIDKYTVCAGYAKSYQMLTRSCGLETYYVTGKTKEGYHAWNTIKIDNEYYSIDCTFDDHSNDRYEYFLVSDNFMKNDGREWEREKFPACTSKKYEFARYKELSSEEDVFNYVVESLRNTGTAFVKTDFEINCFYDILDSIDHDFAYSTTHMDGYIYYKIYM